MSLPRSWASTPVSDTSGQARELIDLVAEAMDDFDDRKAKYVAGREVILAYYEENPRAVFAVSQASKYLLLRSRDKAAA